MAGRQRHAVNEANQNAGVNILLGSIDTAPRVDVRVAATYRERNVVVQSSPTEIATFPWERCVLVCTPRRRRPANSLPT